MKQHSYKAEITLKPKLAVQQTNNIQVKQPARLDPAVKTNFHYKWLKILKCQWQKQRNHYSLSRNPIIQSSRKRTPNAVSNLERCNNQKQDQNSA
jgi:hypothetical protein